MYVNCKIEVKNITKQYFSMYFNFVNHFNINEV